MDILYTLAFSDDVHQEGKRKLICNILNDEAFAGVCHCSESLKNLKEKVIQLQFNPVFAVLQPLKISQKEMWSLLKKIAKHPFNLNVSYTF